METRFDARSFCALGAAGNTESVEIRLIRARRLRPVRCIRHRMTDSAETIRHRTFVFACAVAKVALNLHPRPGIRSLIDQLLKSGTSVGANLEEAKAASTSASSYVTWK
jgi:hypothetical protein